MSATIEADAFFPLDCIWEIVGVYQHEAPQRQHIES